MVYFDNAATSFPKPRAVYDAVYDAMTRFGANPGRGGYKMAQEADETVYMCRRAAADFFGGKPENVIITKNCTEALNTAIKGLVFHMLKRGVIPHIITTDLEHNSVLRPVWRLHKEGLCTVTVINTGETDEDVMSAVKNAANENTRILIMTGAANTFGRPLPLQAAGKFAKDNGIFFICDISQTAGNERITLNSVYADILCMPGHKGLMGPMGTGLMILRDGILSETLTEGGTGSVSSSLSMPDFTPDRYESGTLNLPGISGLYAGINYVSENLESIKSTETRLIKRLYTVLSDIPEIVLYTPFSPSYAPLISFNVKGVDSSHTGTLLGQEDIAVRTGFHCAYLAHKHYKTEKTGTVRISLSGFNSDDDVNIFASGLKKVLNNL